MYVAHVCCRTDVAAKLRHAHTCHCGAAGEVAAKAGVKLSEAESALQALAYDSLAALQVRPPAAGLLHQQLHEELGWQTQQLP
jgi:hypothetical protein